MSLSFTSTQRKSLIIFSCKARLSVVPLDYLHARVKVAITDVCEDRILHNLVSCPDRQ